MTDSDEKQRGLDATMENEASRDLSPMVQILEFIFWMPKGMKLASIFLPTMKCMTMAMCGQSCYTILLVAMIVHLTT